MRLPCRWPGSCIGKTSQEEEEFPFPKITEERGKRGKRKEERGKRGKRKEAEEGQKGRCKGGNFSP